MKRRSSTTPVKIWTFGCKPPIGDNFNVISEQMFLTHKYYNNLITVEKERREKYREVRDNIANVDELVNKYNAVKQTEREASDKFKNEKKASSKSKELKITRDSLRILKKKAYGELKNARQAVKDSVLLKNESKKINENAIQQTKNIRAKSGVYWGTYMLSEKSVEAASKSKIDPSFKKWDGNGRIGVQIQKGAPIQDIFTGKNKFIIQYGKENSGSCTLR